MDNSRYPRFGMGGEAFARTNNRLMSRVFSWMFVGLLMTAIIAFVLSMNPRVPAYFSAHPMIFVGIVIAEIAVVLFLSVRIQKMSAFTATFSFFLYAALNGITFTSVLAFFKLGTVTTAFIITAGMFGIAAVIGYVTKVDLTRFGFIAMMALIGLILATLVNLFIHSSTFTMIISYIGVILFSFLTAYDIQRIKMMSEAVVDSEESMAKMAIIGALTLYLDFVNIFFYLLQILNNDD
ncbi:hypothetical protein SAMN05444392_106152 [Seinonella peptonophila]|uniref:Modulator of FtsH protease n=1 Tax=Seinonella peptonophila TaxID=112248 RepID=A0A1M4YBE6_9BACL|nr:Bax inhibitor-1/YccA family protein [Seinonella peptonophila]SHF03151.1 hypothetical protein SAMN05444392_106152 [Seinonella peptonophila]